MIGVSRQKPLTPPLTRTYTLFFSKILESLGVSMSGTRLGNGADSINPPRI
ncbi:hypothetical protein [uncultured Helicobacter sp.]|uniref:hypothetical protein n=1 Tax=uncultured Helicobacter sp. TaxID=175537 RepID=UPI00374F6E69